MTSSGVVVELSGLVMVVKLCSYISDFFEVDKQSPTPEGIIIEDPDGNREHDVNLLFNSCQRRMCFDISLKANVTRPDQGQQFGIGIAKTPDHGRSVILDDDRTTGIINIH